MPVDLTPAVRQLIAIAQKVGDDDLDRPTPAEGRSVRELLGHLVGLTAAFRAAADKDFGEWTAANPDADGWPVAEPGWLDTLTERGEALARAWRQPEAWEGMTRAGGVDLPGEVAGLVALDEVVIHGWDLARATGQPYECDGIAAEALLEFVGGFDPAGTPGMFGPALVIPADASDFDQVLALTGRDPSWSPGS